MSESRAALDDAWRRLRHELEPLPGAVVAFSGGVDSSVLLHACSVVLGNARTLAVLADSPSLARAEREEAQAFALAIDVPLATLATDEIEDARYVANTGDRCYWCKEALFTHAAPAAEARGWPVLYGENADDVGDHRPGARSAAERGVRAPLRDAGWAKATVRAYARRHGLAVAEKPAMPCLASRLPVGVPVSREALRAVERLEAALRAAGYRVVRARHLGSERVRLEFDAGDLGRALREGAELQRLAREAGYAHCEVDPEGYRSGKVATLPV